MRERYLNKNINHSSKRTKRRFFVFVWKTNLRISWSMTTMKLSSSKYWDNFVKTHIKTSTFSFVVQYLFSTSNKSREIYRMSFFISFLSIWCNATLYFFFVIVDVQNEKFWKIWICKRKRNTKFFFEFFSRFETFERCWQRDIR